MFWKKPIATKCGHVVKKRKGQITVFDQIHQIKISTKNPSYCLECIEKHAIICGICGDVIFPSSLVSILPAKIVDKKPKIPKGAVVCNKKDVIVCSKRDCMGTLGNCVGRLGLNKTIDDL